MRINVLQHTPNEGPGAIQTWAHLHQYDLYVYHPAAFGHLPAESETDLLVLLGGPMSPNDTEPWIKQERSLIKEMQAAGKPIFGACFGAQQIALANGAEVKDAPYKEVGWAPVYLQSDQIPGLPAKTDVLHWHQQMFELPAGASLLFSSKLLKNQGFLLGSKIIGLQFHFEPELDNLREMVVNDGEYAEKNNALRQSAKQILEHGVPAKNRTIMFKLLDFLLN